MMVDVYLRDGRTVLRFRSRASLRAAMRSDVAELTSARPETCWRTFESLDSHGARMRAPFEQIKSFHVARNAISHIEGVDGQDRQEFERWFPHAKDRPAPVRPSHVEGEMFAGGQRGA